MSQKAKWTIMIYLAGDNSLSQAGEIDLREMRSVGSTADVKIVAEFDNAGNKGTKRYLIEHDGKNEYVETLKETDAGSPDVLFNFIEWASSRYPAERYALVLWNHGGGWAPSEIDRIANKVGAKGFTVREAGLRAASPLKRTLFRTTLKEILSRPSPAERQICSDDGSGHSLDTVELAQVLAKAVGKLGQPIDLLGMDACLMSNLEVAYEVRPYVRYIAASEELEPGDGWPYDKVLRHIADHPDVSAKDLAALVVETYITSYDKKRSLWPVTQTALDLAGVEKVAEAIDRLAERLVTLMPDQAWKLWKAQARSVSFFQFTLWDIVGVSNAIAQLTDNKDLREAAEAVIACLEPGADRFIITHGSHGNAVEGCGGVSIYLQPPMRNKLSPYYADLAYSKKHKWHKLLTAYHDALTQ